MVGNYSRRGEDGVGGEHKCGAEDYCDRWRKLWRRTLCDVRQGLRSALSVCVAHGPLCGDERGLGSNHTG